MRRYLLSTTAIKQLAAIDISAIVEVKARKQFKDPEFTPVGCGTPIKATVMKKEGTVLSLRFDGLANVWAYDVLTDITVPKIITPAKKVPVINIPSMPEDKPIGKGHVMTTKAKLATIKPAANMVQVIVLFFVTVLAKTEIKTRFLVHHQVTESLSVDELRSELQHFCTQVNVTPATHVIWKTEDGSAKGGFNLTTWANMVPKTEWSLVRNENLPFIVAGTGSKSLKTATQEVKDQAIARTTTALEALKAQHGDRLVVMSGMAEGFDELLANLAIKLEIPLIAAVPNKGYGAYYWGRNSLTGTDRIANFSWMLSKAKKVVYVMEDVHGIARGLYLNGRHSNFLRNDWMVAQANHFLVWDPSSRGTADCFGSIRKASKSFEILSSDLA
jgi:hypothetical protein